MRLSDRCGRAARLAVVALALAAADAPAQDVFSSGPRQPQPLQTSRNCAATDPGRYAIVNPPSCAPAIADGERRFGVRGSFVTLRESRQIPASWMFNAPTGPCAEGESLVFFTDAGRRLFDQTRGQCDDRFAASPGGMSAPPQKPPVAVPPPSARGDPPASAPVPGGPLPTVSRSGCPYPPDIDPNRMDPRIPVEGRIQTAESVFESRRKLCLQGTKVKGGCEQYCVGGTPAAPRQEAGAAEDKGYWAGVQAGLVNCGLSVTVMLQAFQAMAQGDFEKAAVLMGATDSASGLRSLWQEWTQVQVLDAQGRPLKQFDVGKRQAERVCLYVLLPKAQSCAASGTACALRGASQACGAVLNRVAQLRARVPVTLPAPPSAIFRGLLLVDENYLKQLAIGEGKVIIVRDANRWSMRWIGREGYGAKPMDVKGKTLKPEDLAGLPQAEADRYLGLASAKGMSLEARAELLKKGYKIASPGDQEIIRGPGGPRGFYSDTDLHGVYNLDGSQGWSNALLQKLQCHFFERGVQHGPHDVWPDRNNRAVAGPNYGPQVGNGKALTAYLPDGSAVHVTTLAQMKALYRAIGVKWESVYPAH
jgi:hypothetical protein